MKWKDSKPREYYERYERAEVETGSGWFEVYRLPGNVYAICEPQHIQEVNVYLIIGGQRALLLDTGMGICNIEPLIRELYGGEIIAVNSHCHFDHIGGNHLFEPVYVCNDKRVKLTAAAGVSKDSLGNQLEEDMFLFDYPKDFDPAGFSIKPFSIKLMAEGDRFDLGGRVLRVIATPGHSEDSVMLYDETHRILFTGDSFYLGALYAHFDSDQLGHSDLKTYAESMERALRMAPEAELLYCSHNDFIAKPAMLKTAAEAMREILDAEKNETGKAGVGRGHTYLNDSRELEEYRFDGFSVICRVRK